MIENELVRISFELITHMGKARSCFIQAMSKAKEMEYEEMKELWEEGIKEYSIGKKTHSRLIQKDANEKMIGINVLLIHAEDLSMSAEVFKILCEEFINVYQEINKLKNNHKIH